MFVMEPLPGEDEQVARADATAAADLMTRLLGRPTPDPPLEIDANLRPEGKNGPMVRSVASYQGYWAKTAAAWERQALLRARPVVGDAELGAEFIRAADDFRYPEGGLSTRDVVEIRRIKARVDAERLPRGADPTTHTKLGRGGLSDVEWTIQLLQLQHAFEVPSLRTPATLPAIPRIRFRVRVGSWLRWRGRWAIRPAAIPESSSTTIGGRPGAPGRWWTGSSTGAESVRIGRCRPGSG
jgi:glutamate-ammonia-ligase adenylyltransferase